MFWNLWIRGQPNCSEDTLLLLGSPPGVIGAWQGPRRSFWVVGPLTPPDEPSLSRVGSSKQTDLSCLSHSPGCPGKYSCTAVRNWASGRRKRQEPKQITKSAVGLSPQKSQGWARVVPCPRAQQASCQVSGTPPPICSGARGLPQASAVSLWQLRAGAACELAAVLTVVGGPAHATPLLTRKAAEMLVFHVHAHNPGCLWVVLLALMCQSARYHP